MQNGKMLKIPLKINTWTNAKKKKRIHFLILGYFTLEALA